MVRILKKSIGILGGSFDPAHLGHLKISQIALKKIKLSRILWIITKQNPFKDRAFYSLTLTLWLMRVMHRAVRRFKACHRSSASTALKLGSWKNSRTFAGRKWAPETHALWRLELRKILLPYSLKLSCRTTRTTSTIWWGDACCTGWWAVVPRAAFISQPTVERRGSVSKQVFPQEIWERSASQSRWAVFNRNPVLPF